MCVSPALQCVGEARYANLNAAKKLTDAASTGDTLPADANYALLSVKDQAVWIRFDGSDAVATNSVYLPANTVLMLENSRTLLKNVSMLEAAATATVSLSYFQGTAG
jgi:hypothetical protein